MAARRLFYEDAYLKECVTDVLSAAPCKEGVAVTLKESLFHAQGGGQPADRGWIDGLPVLDVRERDGELLHVLPKAPSRETGVRCELDWDWRYDLMKQHTGAACAVGRDRAAVSKLYQYFPGRGICQSDRP